MIEGFWVVRFRSNQELFGAGVVVLHKGHAYGGDSAYSYRGTYQVDDNGEMRAQLRIEEHTAGITGNVMGAIGDYDLELTGQVQAKRFNMDGRVAQDSSRKMQVELERKSDIA
ncbi:GrlR family regulatory protein [Salinisphaera sp. SPP-AMP-43]|uniref:hypothetical protein n=1 Tax=Salinisphaera sp. SPP-AMP-43 TaxID=3121288 RepID=UPI003C6E0596